MRAFVLRVGTCVQRWQTNEGDVAESWADVAAPMWPALGRIGPNGPGADVATYPLTVSEQVDVQVPSVFMWYLKYAKYFLPPMRISTPSS